MCSLLLNDLTFYFYLLAAPRQNCDRDRKYGCSYCSKAFQDSFKLKRHEAIHTGEKHYSCDICLKTFARKDYFLSHKRVHTGEKHYFDCIVCEKSFSNKGALLDHTRIHTGEKLTVVRIVEDHLLSDDI